MASEVDKRMEESSSDESEASFEEVDASEQDMEAISTLEAHLEANPNLYDKHIEYINLLRKCKMMARLSTARRAMHSKFPLAEELWLAWLDDEIASAHKEREKHDGCAKSIEDLFELAVQDYLSIPIWIKYIKYVSEHDPNIREGNAEGREKVLSIFENSLGAGGLHLSKGSQLWKLYREYEAEHGGNVAPKDSSNPVIRVFHRQLQVPLLDNADTVKELHEFLDGAPSVPAESVKKGQAKAQNMAQARQASEESVSNSKPADTELLANYMAYIKLEEASGEPQRVQCVYERALARFPLTHHLWLQYTQYLEQHLSIPKLVNTTYARAVRNCPWVGILWARQLRALERGGCSEATHEALYSSALTAGMESPEDYMEVLLARVDFLRRKGPSGMEALRAAFRSGTELMQTYFAEYIDRSLRIPAYWSTCELKLAKDHDAARDVWETFLRTPLNMYAESITAYVSMELSADRVKEARSIFRKFHRRSFHENGSVTVCEAWLRFEREHGTADDHLQAVIKTEPVLSAALAAATAVANPKGALESKAAAEKAPQAELSKAEKKRLRQQSDPNFRGPAGNANDGVDGRAQNKRPPREQPKRKKTGIGFEGPSDFNKRQKQDPAAADSCATFLSSGAQDLTTVETDGMQNTIPSFEGIDAFIAEKTASKDATIPPASGASMGPPTSRPPKTLESSADQAQQSQEQRVQAAMPDAAVSRRKCFVKSISSRVDAKVLRETFDSLGQITDFSMPEDRRSQPTRHKGFAYITFAIPESLQEALKLDGLEVGGQAISIALAKQEVPAGHTEAIVMNVPPTADSTALESCLAVFGTVKSLRLPLDRDTSQPRGFAYAEFDSTESLQRAVDGTGIPFQDKYLKINLSTAPIGAGGGSAGRGPSRGGRGQSRGRGGRDGLSRGRGRYGGEDSAAGRGGQRRGGRTAIQLEEGTSVNHFRPRSVTQGKGGQALNSNQDFRASLLKK